MTQMTRGGRLALVDIARGVALIAMTIYHLSWDLEFFGWLTAGTISQTGWVLFARSIATSFLFLVGVSLFLAHRDGIRWEPFAKRLAMVAGGAALISLATWFATPDRFIFFGILHAIALFSLLLLPLIFVPWWVSAAIGLAVLALAEPLRHAAFDTPFLIWLGLAPVNPPSNDYVPLFPWISAAIFGLAAAALANKLGLLAAIKGRASGGLADRTIGLMGRHSLVYYLLHQPVLIALVWIFTAIAGPPDRTDEFMSGCSQTCSQTSDSAFCTKFCTCTADGLKDADLFNPFFAGQVDLKNDPTATGIIRQCSAK